MSQSPSLVVVDAGNSHVVFGFYRGSELVRSLRVATSRDRTADELGALLVPLMSRFGLTLDGLEGVIVASVVPPINATLAQLSRDFFGQEALFIEPGVKTGMPIRYDNPVEVGADRIVNAVAARERWGAPVVVVDFGTATTFDVVDHDGAYIGGVIAPGVNTSLEALHMAAAALPHVDVTKPQSAIGTNTVACIQSGIYWGYVGLVEGIVRQIRLEHDRPMSVIATGGLAPLFDQGTDIFDSVEDDLTMHGLVLINRYNRDLATA